MGGTGKGLRYTDDPMKYDTALLLGNSPTTVDVHDPLYQPEVDDDPNSYVLSSGGGGNGNGNNGKNDMIVMKRINSGSNILTITGPLLTLNEFKIRISDAIREYFDSSDTNEVVRCIAELSCVEYHPEVLKRAVSLGLDAGPRERELISQLLACLHPNPLTDHEMEKGFGLILDSIDDLCIDIPDAKVR
jgi:programmed cell death protein 4